MADRENDTAAEKARVAKAPAVKPDDGSAEFNRRARKRRAEDAEHETERAEEEGRLPENSAITNPAPATAADMTAGGAFVEPEIRQAIPVDHPAVENNPRAGTSAVQNGQDFNDPDRRDPLHPDFAGEGLDLSVYGKAAK